MQIDAKRSYKDQQGFTPQETVITITRENNMSNKKKNNFYSHDLQLTTDSLAYTADEELRNLHDSLRRERDMVLREGYDSLGVETSICYVQRELGIREKRRASHADWMNLHGYTEPEVRTPQDSSTSPAQDQLR